MCAAARRTTDTAEKSTVTPRVSGQSRGNLERGRQFALPGDVALLQRTLGNQAVQRLLAPAASVQRHREQLQPSLGDQPVQRIVLFAGRYAHLKVDKNNEDFKKLSDPAKATIVQQHNDRDLVYEYPDRASMYAFAAGDLSKAPTVTSADKAKMDKSKRRKNRLGYSRANKRVGKVTDNTKFNAPEQRAFMPVFFPMSQTGLDAKSISYTFNKDTKQHDLSYSKKLTPDQQAEVDKMSVTTWEESGTNSMDFIANVGRDVASSFTDTNVTSAPTEDRDSAMGGFSSSAGDFKEKTVGSAGTHVTDLSTHESNVAPDTPTLTIGHQAAYRDTIQHISKKRRVVLGTGETQAFATNPATTDQKQEALPKGLVPSSMSPEQYDIGQHGRRIKVEAKSRRQKGAYGEVNELGSDSGTVTTGLKIPAKKYYSNLTQDRKTREDYKFDQYAPVYSEKQTSGGWGKHFEKNEVKSKDVPQQHYYESDEEMHFSDKEDEPSTPAMMYAEEDTIVSPTQLTLGQPLGFAHNGFTDWTVEAVTAETTAGTEYRLIRWTSA